MTTANPTLAMGSSSTRAPVPATASDGDSHHWRRSWLLLPLAVGLVIRAVATLTYLPGVDFHADSYNYLHNAMHLQPDLWHPLVFPIVLRLLSSVGPVSLIAVAQNVMGLSAGILIYLLGRRLGLSDRWAAAAAAPILLDAWQLAVEQTVMSEPLFELLLMTGLFLLAGAEQPSWWHIIAGGTALSLACLTRTAALPVMALTIAFLAVRKVPKRRVIVAAFFCAVPLLAYAAAFAATFGPFELSGLNGRTLYGETATFANCAALPNTAVDKVLCPTVPLSQRAGSNQYTWDVSSPLNRLTLRSQGKDSQTLELNQRAAAFAEEVIRAQPLDYLRYVADTTARYFTLGREARLQDYPQVAWQFLAQRRPAAVYDITLGARGYNADHPSAQGLLPESSRMLRLYQQVVYTPGPLLAVAALLGLWVSLTRRRHLEAGLLSLGGIATLAMPSLAAGFDYRYLLPALLLLPLAGALALSDLQDSARSWPRLTRRRLCITTSALSVAVILVDTSHAGIVPTSRLAAQKTTAPGHAAVLAAGLTVLTGTPRVNYARCRGSIAAPRWWWSVDIPVTVTSKGAPRLVQGASLTIEGPRGDERQPATFTAVTPDHDVPVAVSRANAPVAAMGGFLVPSATGTVRWSDSAGGGVAQWPLNVSSPRLPAAGTPCPMRTLTLTP